MAEQKKELPSANQKKKSSFLDEGIGKEFLNSWKSMSMTDDDQMDFSFDMSSKGNKKAFCFDEKLALDFNLDNDFSKLSSFKVDLSDLDFSSSPKKSEKGKQKPEGKNSSKPKKRDHFDFNFDFNDLDSFNLDSSLTKSDKNERSKVEKYSVSSKGRDSEVAEKTRNDISENIPLVDDMIRDSTSTRISTSQVETMVEDTKELSPENVDSISKNSPSAILTMSHKCSRSPEIEEAIHTAEEDAEKGLSQKRGPISENVAGNSPHALLSQNGRALDTIAREGSQVGSLSTDRDNSSVSNKNLHNTMTASVDSVYEKSPSGSPSLMNAIKPESNDNDAIMLDSSIAPEATSNSVLDKVSGKDAVNVEDSASTIPLEIPKESSSVTVHKLPSESPTAPASCEHLVDNPMLERYEKVTSIQLKFSSKPAELHSLSQKASSSGLMEESAGKQIGSRQSSAAQIQDSIGRHEGQIVRNPVDDSILSGVTSTIPESGLLSSVTSTGCTNNIRRASSNGQSLAKLVPNVRLEEINVSQGTEKNAKYENKLSSQGKAPSSTVLKSSGSVQPCLNPLLVSSSGESLKNTRTSSGEVNKLLPVKAGKITTDLSRIQTSRDCLTHLRSKGANHILSSSLRHTEMKHLGKSEQNVDAVGGKSSSNNHLMDSTAKQMLQPLNPLQKRKHFEVLDAELGSLKPLKRISPSSSGSRLPPTACQKVKDSPNKEVNQQDDIDEVQIEKSHKSQLLDCQTGGTRSPQNLGMLNVECAVFVDDNGNVKKAEVYAKELEDICNMLKKKQEEAKELLVRAIVNNNNLLMLNHPIYEDKIRKVQKFASQLESNEIRT